MTRSDLYTRPGVEPHFALRFLFRNEGRGSVLRPPEVANTTAVVAKIAELSTALIRLRSQVRLLARPLRLNLLLFAKLGIPQP